MTWNRERAGDRVQYTKETVTKKQKYYTVYAQGNIVDIMPCGFNPRGIAYK